MKRNAGIRTAVLGRGHFHCGDQRQVQRGAEEPRGTSQVSVGNEIIAMGNRKLLGNNQSQPERVRKLFWKQIGRLKKGKLTFEG